MPSKELSPEQIAAIRELVREMLPDIIQAVVAHIRVELMGQTAPAP